MNRLKARINMMKIEEFISYLKTGDNFFEKKDYENALKQYNQAIDLDPTNDEPYFKRANVYTSLNKLHLAIKDFTRAALANPKEPKHLHFRALTYQHLNQPSKAIIDFGRAIKINKENYRSYYQRGIVNNSLGNFQEALIDYTYALMILNTYINKYGVSNCDSLVDYVYEILDRRGRIFLKIRRFKAALADFEEQIKINPNNFTPHYNKGEAYEKLGFFKESIENFFKAGCIALEQDNQELQINSFERIVSLDIDQEKITNEIILAGVRIYMLTQDETVIKNLLDKNLKKVDKTLKKVLISLNNQLNNTLPHDQFQECIEEQLKKVKKNKDKNNAITWVRILEQL